MSTATQEFIIEFETWYKIYPRHVDRGHAIKAYRAARKKVSAEILLQGAQSYANSARSIEKQFVKYPASWLNGECWGDEAGLSLPPKPVFIRPPPEEWKRPTPEQRKQVHAKMLDTLKELKSMPPSKGAIKSLGHIGPRNGKEYELLQAEKQRLREARAG